MPDRPSRIRRYVTGGFIFAIGVFATIWIEPLKRSAEKLVEHGWADIQEDVLLGEVGAYLFIAILFSFIISVVWGIVAIFIARLIQRLQDRRESSDV